MILTWTIRPTHAGSPGRFTTVLPDVRPDSSHSRRRLFASIRTGSTRPIAASNSSPWIDFWSACSATIRRVFSSSVTSSGMRLSASVFGRGEYLNEYMLWYRAACGQRQRLLEILRRLAGEADDHIGR